MTKSHHHLIYVDKKCSCRPKTTQQKCKHLVQIVYLLNNIKINDVMAVAAATIISTTLGNAVTKKNFANIPTHQQNGILES